MKYSISVGTVNLILHYIHHKGVDAGLLCQELGIDERILKDPDERIVTPKLQGLWRKAIDYTGIEQLPLFFGEWVNPYSLGLLSYLLMNSPTLGFALISYAFTRM